MIQADLNLVLQKYIYLIYTMEINLCKGKSTSNPNRCKKVSGCKVANGTKRTFCRKKHNKNTSAKRKTVKRRRSADQQITGLTRKAIRELRRLK